jgi:predicted SnoaL-like aldol condensation-catalyzing enzyme
MNHKFKWSLLLLVTSVLPAYAQSALPVPAVVTAEATEVRNRSVLPPASAKVSDAQQDANKLVVLQWHYEFFDLGHFADACNKYMAEDFQQNDPREPSGRANYVKAFQGNGYVAKKPEERPPLLAVFAEGDMVITVIPEGWKPGQSTTTKGPIHTNMYRLRDGKIIAMWVSGSS